MKKLFSLPTLNYLYPSDKTVAVFNFFCFLFSYNTFESFQAHREIVFFLFRYFSVVQNTFLSLKKEREKKRERQREKVKLNAIKLILISKK